MLGIGHLPHERFAKDWLLLPLLGIDSRYASVSVFRIGHFLLLLSRKLMTRAPAVIGRLWVGDRRAVAVLVPGVGESAVLEQAAEAVVAIGERLAVTGDAGQPAFAERTRVVGIGRFQRRVGIAHGGHPVEGVGGACGDEVAGIGLRQTSCLQTLGLAHAWQCASADSAQFRKISRISSRVVESPSPWKIRSAT